MTERPRRPWLALLLGVLFGGLGQLYAGAPLRALAALAALFVLLPFAALIRALLDFSLTAVMIGVALQLLIALIVPVDGALTARKRSRRPATRWNRLWIYAGYAAVFVVLVVPALRWELDHFWFRLHKIPAGGMEDTLRVGDYVISDSRESTLFAVGRGDVVVFRYPPQPQALYIKRIVGLPGETIELRAGMLQLDGRSVEEPYVRASYRDRDANGDFGPVVVQEDHYFVLGDHRSASADSRVFGQVPRGLLVGRARSIWWSIEAGAAGRFESRSERLGRWLRKPIDGLRHTRWERLGTSLSPEPAQATR